MADWLGVRAWYDTVGIAIPTVGAAGSRKSQGGSGGLPQSYSPSFKMDTGRQTMI
jgi:hypothetical protein